MRVLKKDYTVIVSPKDDLEKVPPAYQEPLTRRVRQAFADPAGHFEKLARRCPVPNMKSWMQALATRGSWELHLYASGAYDRAGFWGRARGVRGAMIGLCEEPGEIRDFYSFSKVSPKLSRYYQVVDFVLWHGFNRDGGLCGPGVIESLSMLEWTSEYPYDEAELDAENTHTFGHSARGDLLFFTTGNRAGWLRKGSGQVVWLGSVADALNWVFGELLAGREPRCPQGERRVARPETSKTSKGVRQHLG